MSKDIQHNEQLKMFILDILHYDYESIPHLIHGLNGDALGWRDFWHRDFSLDDVLPRLESLLSEGLVMAFREDGETGNVMPSVEVQKLGETQGDYHDLWFGLTNKGWQKWYEWELPESSSERA